MITTHFIHDPRPEYPMKVLANRYRSELSREDGITLVFMHATGTHKETWEPIIEYIFNTEAVREGQISIREAWSIEFPNHGESALVNQDYLQSRIVELGDGYDYPRAVHAFLRSSPDGTDFTKHKLVGVGHSIGGEGMVLLQGLQPRLPFQSLVLFEATVGDNAPLKDQMIQSLITLTCLKKDTWPNREAARHELSRSPGYKRWDKRTLDLFVDHSLIPHPFSKYPPPFSFKGVTLACPRSTELAIYHSNTRHELLLMEIFDQLLREGVALHIVHASKNEYGDQIFTSQYDQSKGRIPASLQVIDSGHLMPQMAPVESSKAILNALLGAKGPQLKSRY